MAAPAPLRGLRVLLTRPADQAEESAAVVTRLSGEALIYPCLVLAPPDDPEALRQALSRGGWDIVAWASANAVRAVLGSPVGGTGGGTGAAWEDGAAGRGADDARVGLSGAVHAAVGERTAAALQAAGVEVAVVAKTATAEGLVAALREAMPLRGRQVLVPRAAAGREALVDGLREAGAEVTAVAAYRMGAATSAQLQGAVDALRAGAVDLVPLGSPRTAAILLAAFASPQEAADLLSRTSVGAIGETTAASLRAAGIAVDVVAGEAAAGEGDGAPFTGLLLALANHRRGARPCR